MAKPVSSMLRGIVSLLVLALAITTVISARILDEEVAPPVIAPEPDDGTTVQTPVSGVNPPAAGGADAVPAAAGAGAVPAAAGAGAVPAEAGAGTVPAAAGAGAAPAAAGAGAAVEGPDHALTFFMHDILGGSQPTAIAVTGIVANPAVSGQVPFAKPNGAVLSVDNSVPTNNGNSAILNNNNVPFLSGLSGFTNNIVQNNNGNPIIGGGFGFPAINLAQFPTGTTLQKLMFGTMTVFDDELTEGHELGSGLIGKAQGFYVSSSQDGISQTMLFNVMFRASGYVDSLCFFGVHRSGTSESHLAIMGGTGKYVNAKGFATVKTFAANPNLQHETDGMETVLMISVYLA